MSATEPLVRVVMPVRDAETTVEAAIRSVLGQSCERFELVVVDDGSTDRTVEHVRSAMDDRCRLIRQPNAGPSAARNTGAAGTDAALVAFIDADDLWLPDKLASQVAALTDAPDAVAAYGWVDLVDAELRTAGTDGRPRAEGDVAGELRRRNFIFSGSNTLLRTRSFVDVGGFDERLWGAEDWELHCRLARLGAFVVVPRVVVRYRQRPDSLSADLDRMAAAYGLAREVVFGDRGDTDERREADASFWFYLAVRATQTGRPRDLARAVRLFGRAVQAHPGVVAARLRRSSPLASVRLSARSALARRRPPRHA